MWGSSGTARNKNDAMEVVLQPTDCCRDSVVEKAKDNGRLGLEAGSVVAALLMSVDVINNGE